MRRLVPLLFVSALAASQPACYGSYGAFNTLHKWNGKATGNKVANSAIHFLLWFGVYELALAGDFLIFNNLEFLTGDNVFK